MDHREDADSQQNDFSLLFGSQETKEAAKRHCLELIQNELENIRKESDTVEPEVHLEVETERGLPLISSKHGDVDNSEFSSQSIESQEGVDETDRDENDDAKTEEILREAEIENYVYERVFLFTLENGTCECKHFNLSVLTFFSFIIH